jgi:hypothetical protein
MMSKHLDDVMNGSKDAVRECEVPALAPDKHVEKMVAFILEGVRHLDDASVYCVTTTRMTARQPRRPMRRSSPNASSNAPTGTRCRRCSR